MLICSLPNAWYLPSPIAQSYLPIVNVLVPTSQLLTTTTICDQPQLWYNVSVTQTLLLRTYPVWLTPSWISANPLMMTCTSTQYFPKRWNIEVQRASATDKWKSVAKLFVVQPDLKIPSYFSSFKVHNLPIRCVADIAFGASFAKVKIGYMRNLYIQSLCYIQGSLDHFLVSESCTTS